MAKTIKSQFDYHAHKHKKKRPYICLLTTTKIKVTKATMKHYGINEIRAKPIFKADLDQLISSASAYQRQK